MVSLGQGKKLIRLARDSILSTLSGKEIKVKDDIKEEFGDVLGVFVTLNKGGELRGCIGFPEGVFPLYEGVFKAASSAAFSDPRFAPVSKEEMADISIEVSVLTKPVKVTVRDSSEYIEKIKVVSH